MVIELLRPLAYILVKLSRTRAGELQGLEDSVIPVEPLVRTFKVDVELNGKTQQRTVKRSQSPITAAYAFTDYQAQGQMIPSVIVDVAIPPSTGHNFFNLYVTSSRSSSRTSIRLFRDFDNAIFMHGQDAELLAKDDRLERAATQTKV
ncbi:hypothetical protein BDQ17DRAFT_1318214 [Cyathus striatus]|nr:hypothetical protein BDQ17DRAFT_1318214 [Cyathus striatus]